MAYDGKLLARARTRLEEIRAENGAEHARRTARVYALVPEIAELDRAMRAQMAELVRLSVSRTPDLSGRLDALRRENLELQARKAELLCEHGFSIDYLDEIYSCPKCRDTGNVGSVPCECLTRLYNAELTHELGALMRSGEECFEKFDLTLYPALPNAKGVVPREMMAKVFEGCRKFAANFPEVSVNLMLRGGPGLGKTYLSACIARTVAGKGYSVCYDSAAAALDAFERQRFSRDASEQEAAAARVRRMLECDLMILDDLGTEMITPMSLSSLYTLINTRLVNGRRMIVSTNLSDSDLKSTYTPQLCSRLTGEFLILPFEGNDIRQMKK